MAEPNAILMSGQQFTSSRFIVKNIDIDDLHVSDGGNGEVIITPNAMAEFVVSKREDGTPVWTVRRAKQKGKQENQ